MTLTFKIILSLTLAFVFSSAFGQSGLKIKFFNKTGHDISDLTFQGQKIVALKNNDSTAFLKFDSLLFCGIAPCIGPKGNIKGIKINESKGYCGNGTENIKKGIFKNDIILSAVYHGGQEIWLGQHKKRQPKTK
jgi:hypothetical protein